MTYLPTLILGVLFLQIGVTIGAPKRRRWIPERMSDNDYGMDTHSMSSTDGSMLNQPNYLSYWSDYFPGGYNGGDYSGMLFRSGGGDSNHAMMDPVQQLQHVQAYSYAQALQNQYPYGAPYPPPPPQAYAPTAYQGEAGPTGRSLSLLKLGALNNQHQQFMSSPNAAMFVANQRPVFMNAAQSPLVFSTVEQQQPQILLVNQSPQTNSQPVTLEILDNTESAILAPANQVKNTEQLRNALVALKALNLESTSTQDNSNSVDGAALLVSLLNAHNDHSSSSAKALQNEVLKAIIQAGKNQEAQQTEQEIKDAEAILETVDAAAIESQPLEKESIVIVEDSSPQKHQKTNPQTHSHTTHENVKIKVTESKASDNQVETVDVAETKTHSHSNQHETKDKEQIVVKITETEKQTSHNAKNIQKQIKDVEAAIEDTKAAGRAHEDSVNSSPPYESNRYSPLDLVYPGVMAPAQNRPTAMVPPYYQQPQYGTETQQYASQPAMPGNPYLAYQYPQPSQYPTYNPYGSYAPQTMPQYSSGYYNTPSSNPPRVTRNSVAAMPGTVKYVYGGTIYPQFG